MRFMPSSTDFQMGGIELTQKSGCYANATAAGHANYQQIVTANLTSSLLTAAMLRLEMHTASALRCLLRLIDWKLPWNSCPLLCTMRVGFKP
jgi:hypothetical protein